MVTVVIPAYNAEAWVGKAIGSVLAQSHNTIQLIVVDDGSTDRTGSVVGSMEDSRLELAGTPNCGVCHARNIGLRMAQGHAIAFLDADDYWLPDKLSRQLAALESQPDLVAVGSYMRYVSDSDETLGTTGSEIGPQEAALVRTAHLMPFPLSSVLFRTEIVRRAGGFDESLPGQAEDLDMLARMAQFGAIACVPDVLGAYRVHRGGVSAQHLELQRAATRFVRARLAGGNDATLTWEEFERTYRPTRRQRHGDRVQWWYRSAALNAAERRWVVAIGYGLLALLAGPRYTIRRLARQRGLVRS